MSTLVLTAKDVAEELCISKSGAYKIIQTLNEELDKAGYTTVHGKVNRDYFYKRFRYETDNKNK